MALDGIFLSKIKDELLREISFGRVEKIHQPSREELVIHLRGKNGAKKLFLSIRGNSPRIHLTEHARESGCSTDVLYADEKKAAQRSACRYPPIGS